MPNSFISSISGIFDSAKSATSGANGGESSSIANKALNILDPSKSRLEIAGLLSGGKRKPSTYGSGPDVRFVNDTPDWRVKIRLGTNANYFYKDTDKGFLEPLDKTDGVIFPYTPSISVSHTARYGSQNLTHSNYTNYFYEGSEVQAITVAGEFTVQNIEEGRYLMACIQFFRAATKMFFGGNEKSPHAGNPPPMVFLDGYGKPYFSGVPCVITNFTHTMPSDVDYINVKVGVEGEHNVRLPLTSTISVTLQPIYSRRNLFDNFDLNEFARGNLLNKGFL